VPLRLRLALWYGSLTTLIVMLVCGYSYAIHSRTHYDELDRVLHGVATHVRTELAAKHTTETEPDVIASAPLLGAGIRLLDRDGRLRAASGVAVGMSALDVPALFRARYERPYPAVATLVPALHRPEHAPGRFGLLRGRGGERTRVYAETLSAGEGFLVATMPLAHIDAAVSGFGALMMTMALAAGFLAFGAGWLLARRALRPVATLTDAAAAIAKSRSFSRRVTDGTSRDELGQLARTFNTMLGSLEEAYESQVRFVSAASHELRAPLTVIQANLDLLRTAPMPASEREIALVEASSEAGRMARLVADLLALARADAGVPIRKDRVELDRIVVDVLGEARHLARGQRVELVHVEPMTVLGDADRLKQLFLNLVENAIKYTPPGGQVSVSITRDGSDGIVVVRDDGVGIDATDLPRVFERFYRADPARSRNPGGSGLGLSIAQWVASEHGGSLALDSRLGEGTTVTVRLPAEG
jgi:two-component system OmpR family sensor kinase